MIFVGTKKNYKKILENMNLGILFELFFNEFMQETNMLKEAVKRRRSDQHLQTWINMFTSSKGITYGIFKKTLELELYFNILDKTIYNIFFRFRISNQILPVEKGRWINVVYDNRNCTLCNSNTVGGEFYYLNKYCVNRPKIM